MMHWKVISQQSIQLLRPARRLVGSNLVGGRLACHHASCCCRIHPIHCRLLSGSSSSQGQTAFEEYQSALEALEKLRETKQAQQSKAMFQAWQEQQQNDDTKSTTKAGGVQVIRTLVREQQPKKQQNTDLQVLEQQAQSALETAVDAGYGPALLTRANELLEEATDATVPKALALYRQAGEAGHATAWFNLGHVLWTGVPEQDDDSDTIKDNDIVLRPDPQSAMNAFEAAMELGDTDALYFCGVQYLNDENNSVDKRKTGLDWIEQAAAKGHSEALYYLALFYRQDDKDLGISAPTSPRDFMRRLEAAAEAQSTEALFLRGHSYYTGDDGYTQDYSRALTDFVAAADLGHADAAVSAGAMLCMPHAGVHQDAARAFEYYQRAGELGSKEGWRNVVDCYLHGRGVPQSTSLATYIAETMLRD